MNVQPAAWLPDPEDASQWRYWNGTAWTEHRSPRSGGATPRPVPVSHTHAGPTGKWYFVITLVSVGLLSAVPFFHAASRLQRPSLRTVGAAFAAVGLLSFAMVGSAPTNDSGEVTGWLSSLGSTLALGNMFVASLLLIGLRRQVYDAVLIRPPSRNQGAMSDVGEARRRRGEARRLAAADPMMARELGIGRPDLDRYDDGGLLDLNVASVDQLVTLCGLRRDHAARVVDARTAIGRFLSIEDAIVYGQLSEDETELLRERGVVIGRH